MFGLLLASSFFISDIEKAPPNFSYSDSEAIFVDFKSVDLTWEFDVKNSSNIASASIVFESFKEGYPILDLIPTAVTTEVNGESSSLKAISPGNATNMKVVDKKLPPGQHTLDITYKLDGGVSYSNGAVRVGAFMGDLSDRGFFEKYAPTNLEYDQYKQSIVVKIKNSTKEHKVYTNGSITSAGTDTFKVDFPEYFITSSFYLHFAEAGRFQDSSFVYLGVESSFPVVVYAESSNLVNQGVASTKKILAELETTYGVFGHDSLTIYITSGGGGMEYCGATMTSMGALGHELTHSWFARGVMPANGNAGWIDEAIASWRDNGYPRRNSPGSAANMGAFSPYRRHTTRDAYSLGMQFIGHLDYILRDKGGMKGMLQLLFASYKRQTITTPQFKTFLENVSGVNLNTLFDRYVYGKNVVTKETDKIPSQHPRPYTQEELDKFR